MPSKYVDVQGIATFLRHTGGTTLPGSPPDLSRGEIVLCLHHGGGNSRTFDAFSAALSEEHGPLAFDLPGHDRSASQVSLGTVEAMADFAAALLKTLKADRPAVIVGHGMGGNVALQMALAHSECVRALVLVGCAAAYACGDELIERTRLVSQGRARRDFDMTLYAKGCAEKTIRSGYMDTLKTDPRVVYANLLALKNWDGSKRIGEIEVPTLVCVGEGEYPNLAEEMDRMTEKMATAKKESIASAAHMLPTEQSEALAKTVSNFLGELS